METVFTSNFHETNIYLHYPNDEVDKAWTDLYNGTHFFLYTMSTAYTSVEFGLSQISKSEAMLLPNKTLPIPADPEHYMIALSVFHQIHCLVSSMNVHVFINILEHRCVYETLLGCQTRKQVVRDLLCDVTRPDWRVFAHEYFAFLTNPGLQSSIQYFEQGCLAST